jgi:NAD(P)-dependent dehydrogenase (short-subunit alcohol dehydrogenase family)/acyl carrier protein
MVEHGARQLALVARHDPQGAAADAIAQLERSGARILALRTDVSQPADVERLIATIGRELAPLRGVIHAAGVLDDGVLLNQTAERFATVMAPKIAGGWNLHQATRDLPLDFFVMFSGAGTLLGSPGQGNYAAANAFLDGLARARCAEGLPAQSIAWGPWSDVGLAARADRGGRIALRGVRSLTPSDGVEALGRVMRERATQIAVLPLDLRQCLQSYPVLAGSPLFEVLARGVPDRATPAQATFRHTLSALPPAERHAALEHHLREHAASVLGLPVARIGLREPLNNLGFDSLMTLELRNRIESSLGLKLSATVVWNHPTIKALSEYLERKLELAGIDSPAPPTPLVPAAPSPDVAAAVDRLTDAEVATALAQTLGQLAQGDRHDHAR